MQTKSKKQPKATKASSLLLCQLPFFAFKLY